MMIQLRWRNAPSGKFKSIDRRSNETPGRRLRSVDHRKHEEQAVDYVGWVQWPAMVVTVLAAWLIGSRQPRRRVAGFSCFIASNILWVIWGLHTDAYALIVLQFCLCAMNLRGFRKNTT